MMEATLPVGRKAHEVALVNRLLELARKADRGALAALRSGLGKRPGTAHRMFPFVAPFLRSDEGAGTQAAFLVASLFASHPSHAEVGSLGASLWRATKRDQNKDGKHGEAGVEARLVAVLDSHPDDLPRHLTGLVSLCESAGAPIDWHALYWDVLSLLGDDEDRRIKTKTRWARQFWQGPREQRHPQTGEEETTD